MEQRPIARPIDEAAPPLVQTIRATGVKPRFRGIPDVIATAFIVPSAALMLALAQEGSATIAATVYTLSLTFLFGISATYHTPMWPLSVRGWLRRADHSAIYVLIAGTYTPACMLSLEGELGTNLLWFAWGFAALGILKSFLWTSSPRWLNTAVYVAFGWMIAPFIGELWTSAGPLYMGMIAAGGLLYSIGAVIYAKKLLNKNNAVFGYHEWFHVFVIGAAACHFVATWSIVV